MIKISKVATIIAAALFSAFQGDLVATASTGPSPEVILWPHRKGEVLYVARETVQPFYIMGYSRGHDIPNATSMEMIVPSGWSAWLGANPPPDAATGEGSRITFPVAGRSNAKGQKKYLQGYIASRASASSLFVIKAEDGAKSGTLKIRWTAEDKTLAECNISLVPTELSSPAQNNKEAASVFGVWMNDPHFHPLTMSAIYKGLARSGIDYVIITKDMYRRDKQALLENGLKIYIKQWWKYDGYLPDRPPADAVSVMKDGSVDHSRWSPTYMAEKGEAFVNGVRSVVAELGKLDGIYGFILDYEPTAKGIDADYGEKSKQAFEKYLGKSVSHWPEDVFEKGPLCEQWIDFRVSQSDAYVRHFKSAIKEHLPHLKLAVSTSGVTGAPSDPNRRLAVVDIAQLSEITDSIHPQLYSWTSRMPEQSERYLDKMQVGRITSQSSKTGVYTAIGAGVGGSELPDPALLRTQVLYWWLVGSDGFEVWQYFYGVDGRYLQILSDVAQTIRDAGAWPRPHQRIPATSAVKISPAVGVEALLRPAGNSSDAIVGLFNFSSAEKTFNIEAVEGWSLVNSENVKTIAPWSAELVKVKQTK